MALGGRRLEVAAGGAPEVVGVLREVIRGDLGGLLHAARLEEPDHIVEVAAVGGDAGGGEAALGAEVGHEPAHGGAEAVRADGGAGGRNGKTHVVLST